MCLTKQGTKKQQDHPYIHLLYIIGIHPHMVYGCKKKKKRKKTKFFASHLEWDAMCMGIGEVGLDYTTSCQCKQHHTKMQEKISPMPRLLLKSPSCRYCFPKLNPISMPWLYILMDLVLLMV